VDGGSTWTDITTSVTGTSISWAGATLDGTSEIQLKVTDAAGNDGAVETQAYVLDTTAPTLTGSTPADEDTDVALDSTITLTFSEDIALGDSGTITVTDGSDSHTIDVSSHAGQLSITNNTLTIDLSSDLANNEATYHVEVSAGAIEDLAGNDFSGISNSSTLNFDTVAAPSTDTSIVVFDLVNGTSSDHSSRTFQSEVDYTIYLMVDSDNAGISAVPTWSGADQLGSGDTIILVGDTSAPKGWKGQSISQITSFTWNTQFLCWRSHTFTGPPQSNPSWAGVLGSTGLFYRYYSNLSGPSIDLFNGTIGNLANISALFTPQVMPNSILSSQGLA
jgi:methionine-rich copper-binding protein CopC